jgi:hypothetical protein
MTSKMIALRILDTIIIVFLAILVLSMAGRACAVIAIPAAWVMPRQ